MSDSDHDQPPGLSIPPDEYRPHRDDGRGGIDPSMRNLVIAAVGIAVVVMGGVFVLSRSHSGAVPVIEPDPRPLRIKPTDPGGMQIAGADDTPTVGADGAEADQLIPPPETPAPQVLQQQAARANQAATLPPAAAPAAPLPVTPPAPPAAAPTPAPIPEPAPEPVEPRPLPPAAARPTPAATAHGTTEVQLAALDSEAAATAAWAALVHRMPDLLAGHTPAITRADRNGKTFWRLRTAGFADIAEATSFCTRLRAKGGACAIAAF